jgi:hypothetical protein
MRFLPFSAKKLPFFSKTNDQSFAKLAFICAYFFFKNILKIMILVPGRFSGPFKCLCRAKNKLFDPITCGRAQLFSSPDVDQHFQLPAVKGKNLRPGTNFHKKSPICERRQPTL